MDEAQDELHEFAERQRDKNAKPWRNRVERAQYAAKLKTLKRNSTEWTDLAWEINDRDVATDDRAAKRKASRKKTTDTAKYQVWASNNIVYIKWISDDGGKGLSAAKKEARSYISTYSQSRSQASTARSRISALGKGEIKQAGSYGWSTDF